MTMPNVELVYDPTCPNRKKARANLLKAFSRANVVPSWTEWERSDPKAPDYVGKYGSPTILVNGEDAAGEAPGDGAATCRIYMDGEGRRDVVPSVDVIASALTKAGVRSSGGASGALSVLPAIGVALLPKLTCPACWPAYAWLLGVFSISFVNYTPYLTPIMALFLALAVAPLAWRAKSRRGYRPFALGLASSVIAMIGKFWLGSAPVMYAGFGLLVAAFMWNAWPVKTADDEAPCPACVRDNREGVKQL